MFSSLVRRWKLRLKDMGTITALNLGAETIARKCGEEKPAAEHFLLSALDLPDGTARRVFERLGVNPDELDKAFEKQHHEALDQVGVDASKLEFYEDDFKIEKPKRVLYEVKPSAQTLMKDLHKLKKEDKDVPLLGLHVLQVLSAKEYGVVPRTLKILAINQKELQDALCKELEVYMHSMQ